MVGYFSESTTSGCHSTCVLSEKEPRIEKNGSGECVKVSFDIRNICVVFARRCCKEEEEGFSQTVQNFGIT